ncbi:HK97 family phage prohead protease [Oricola thermophila]|uniref:HK97 family phage prohead protease n=1 Tax=Oricola thermophila TaxID=2742145 RepID=A0A6N1VLZ6_9HYPH|nr:HK97 family phage prohead protease [Oricola thermophila]QKV20249.1 HK97 family phage prohead protease [Oricola thermophila]
MTDRQTRKMPTNGSADLPLETREAPVNSIDAEKRTVEVVWTAGAAVPRVDPWTGDRYVEELVVSDKAIKLDRLNNGGPVLDSHFRFGINSQIAVVERAWIEGGKGLAKIRFPKEGLDEEIDRIFSKIADGIITRLSCGYRRLKIEVDKSKDPKVWRVVEWEPFEISFVSVPADPAAKVRADEVPTSACEFRTIGAPSGPAARARMRLRAAAAGLVD